MAQTPEDSAAGGIVERRSGGDRRSDSRQGGRRGTDPRTAAGIAMAVMSLAGTAARADVYTRINSKGVLEATNLPTSRQDFKLAYRSKGTLVHSAGFSLRASANREFDQHIEAAAALHGVSRELVRAIIQVESAFDRLAVSTAGARGLMQLMPATARRFGVADCFDARQNIFAGTRYLRVLLDTYGGDISLSAAAYNAGEAAVARYSGIPPYPETQDYVRKVNALLGGAVETVAVSVTPAMFISPGDRTAPRAATASRAAAPAAKRTRTYHKWIDAKGVVHMEQAPPATGAYTTIRSTD